MRKTIEVLGETGRDAGKIYVITEFPATKAEKWAMRALLALTKAGVDIPPDAAEGGIAAIAMLGLRALGGMSFADAEALMDEMFQCVQIRPDPAKALVRPLIEEDIEEIATRLKLRAEVFSLHTGFSIPGALSTSTPATPSAPVSRTIPMSRAPSGR